MTGFVKRVEPVVADHGEGALLYDADGTEYIDCFAGISVTNAGHGNRQDHRRRQGPGRQARARLHLRLPRGERRRPRREARPDHARATCRRRSSATQAPRRIEGAMRLAKRYSGKTRVRGASSASFHGRTLCDALDHRQRGPQEGRRPLHAGRRLRADALLLPLPAEPRARRVATWLCARRVGEIGAPAPLRRRLRLHRRAGDGRGRHHRAARRLLPRRQGDPRRRGHPLHRRRGAERLRAHRQACSPSSTTASSPTS